MSFLLIYICLFVIIALILVLKFFIKDPSIDVIERDYNYNIIDLNKEFECKLISLEEFNKLFEAELVILPISHCGVGYFNDIMYLYNQNLKKTAEKTHFLKYLLSFLRYWSKEIQQNFKDIVKYHFVIDLSDGHLGSHGFINASHCLRPMKYPKDKFINCLDIQDISYTTTPILHKHKQIFTFSGLRNDPLSFCVPDPYFIDTKNHDRREDVWFKELDKVSCTFDQKKNKVIFRGDLSNGHPINSLNSNYRNYLHKLYKENKLHKSVDMDTNRLNQAEMADNKFILDIDGWSNCWDALRWKLYSGSVVLKVMSPFKQWYYDDLKPYVHYIPIKSDCSDINEVINWCFENLDLCGEIGNNGRQYIKNILTYDNVTELFRNKVNTLFRQGIVVGS